METKFNITENCTLSWPVISEYIKENMLTGRVIYKYSIRGEIKDLEGLKNILIPLGEVIKTRSGGNPSIDNDQNGYHYNLYKISKNAHLEVTLTRNKSSFQIFGFDKEHIEAFYSTVSKLIIKSSDTSDIYMISNGSSGLTTTSIGKINTKFIPLNYTSEVLKDFEHIVECLNSKNPCGRLNILSGPPGTGKSYLIRSLVSKVRGTFIFIPSSMVGELTGPNLTPLLLGIKEENEIDYSDYAGNLGIEDLSGTPIILILEDADDALIHREQGNLNKISEVLNLGDGLMGQLLDVRIIATTNARTTKFDPAITRSGRMCRHTKTSNLSKMESNEVYKSLTGEEWAHGATSLANIYQKSRNREWVPENEEDIKSGVYL